MVTKLETQGKQIFQWGEKFVDIATLEKAVYEAVLSLGRNIMRQCIEEADRTLARQRDRGMYRDKGYRPTTLKTVMGEVGYQRHVYLLSGAAEQPRATVYLLDRSMGLDTVGLFSDTVCVMAVEAACAVSHRTAAATLNDLTGLSLSHESVWRIVQNAGSWEQARVDSLAAAAKAECGSGTYETPVLYEEMDGVYLALQGKDRLEHGPSKEMKVSIAYSGIYEDASGRRSLANKVSYASMEQAEHFRRHAEGVVADFYAVDCVKRRVFNSDGGTWLQRNMVPGCTYQLDLFHRNRAVRTCVNDPDLQETILELFHARKVKEAIAVVEASIESTLDPDEQEKRRKLFTYFNNYRKSLIPYYQRSGRKPPLPNEGQQPARCGSMESNIFTIIGNRMKHNRTCWSVAGANNLAALLALHRTGHLRRVLRDWTAHGAPSKLYTIMAPISAKQTNKQMSEIYIPPHLLSAGDLHPAAKYCLTKFFPLSEMHTTE